MGDGQERRPLLTQEGQARTAEELRYLKTEKRRLIAEKIEAAKELGDLSENAEYAEAKEEQALTEARILELEHLLKNAEVVASSSSGSLASIGSTVTIKDEGGERTYTIVGLNETEPAAGKISNESPLGQALFGKAVGDTVTYQAPSGPKRFTITRIA